VDRHVTGRDSLPYRARARTPFGSSYTVTGIRLSFPFFVCQNVM
jgi:hypothetical protein